MPDNIDAINKLQRGRGSTVRDNAEQRGPKIRQQTKNKESANGERSGASLKTKQKPGPNAEKKNRAHEEGDHAEKKNREQGADGHAEKQTLDRGGASAREKVLDPENPTQNASAHSALMQNDTPTLNPEGAHQPPTRGIEASRETVPTERWGRGDPAMDRPPLSTSSRVLGAMIDEPRQRQHRATTANGFSSSIAPNTRRPVNGVPAHRVRSSSGDDNPSSNRESDGSSSPRTERTRRPSATDEGGGNRPVDGVPAQPSHRRPKGRCKECEGLFPICNDGTLQQHEPCGKTQADAEQWKEGVRQWERVSRDTQRTKSRRTHREEWVIQCAHVIMTTFTSANREEHLHPSTKGTSSIISEGMAKLIALTPPGAHAYPIEERGEYEASGFPIGYSIREDKDPTQDQNKADEQMSQINKALFVDRRIGRTQQILNSAGHANLADPRDREKLRSKYRQQATPRPDVLPEWILEIEPHDPDDFGQDNSEWDLQVFTDHVVKKQRGCGRSISGWSYDDLQDLFKAEPEVIQPLCKILQAVANGACDDNTRSIMLMGKGIAFRKKTDDVRPVACRDPFAAVVGHMVNRRSAEIVKQIVGPTQVGGSVSGGIESMPHAIRQRLQRHKDYVLYSKDAANAWHSIAHWAIIEVLERLIPNQELTRYMKWELGGPPVKVAYHDRENDLTIIHHMWDGLIQGSNTAGAVYNIPEALILKWLWSKEKEQIREQLEWIACYDDITMVGPPMQAMRMSKKIDEQFAVIGVKPNLHKEKIYGFGNAYSREAQEQAQRDGTEWAPPDEGVVVVGTPIGSEAFERRIVQDKVDIIKKQLVQLAELLSATVTYQKAKTQWAYHLVRLCMPSQLNYLLRTVHPSRTKSPAEDLDRHIVEFVTQLTGIKEKVEAQSAGQRVIDQILSQISRGGMGFIKSADAATAAYLGSWALVGNQIESMLPGTADYVIDAIDPAGILALITNMKEFVDEDLTAQSIFRETNPKIQKKVYGRLAKIRATRYYEAQTSHEPRAGVLAGSVPEHIRARIVQANTNRDSAASAWLTMLPTDARALINNETFKLAVTNRLLLPCWDDPVEMRCNACNKPACFNFAHVRNGCKRMVNNGTRQPIRNRQHTEVQEAVAAIVRATPAFGYAVSQRTSDLAELFGFKDSHAARQADGRTMYGDLLLIDRRGNRPNLVIDITVAEPVGKANDINKTQTGFSADLAEKTKRQKWAREGYNITNSAENHMVVFAIDTNGGLGNSARQFMTELAEPDELGVMARWKRIGWFSALVQAIFARTVVKARSLVHSMAPMAPQAARRTRAELSSSEEEDQPLQQRVRKPPPLRKSRYGIPAEGDGSSRRKQEQSDHEEEITQPQMQCTGDSLLRMMRHNCKASSPPSSPSSSPSVHTPFPPNSFVSPPPTNR